MPSTCSSVRPWPKPEADTVTMNSTAWTKERIEELLSSEDFRYQNIDLPHGLSTGGYDRRPTADQVFPADLSGKTVLDLGCSFGYFCFEALRRGAARVVGYDVDPDSVRKARLLAEAMGSTAVFENRDIERTPISESFDYVLCLNLLHHLRHPLAALDHIIERTNERLVLEVATLGAHDRKKVGISAFTSWMIGRLPTIFVTRSATRGRREIQKFYMTPTAIENFLIYQRGMFARLDSYPSPHKGRFIAIAHKRRIGQLLVVSSPTSAGKKTLMRRLLANELPSLAQELGSPDGSVWGQPLNANRIFEPDEPERDRLMLHHDFLRPYLRSTMTHERDEANDIISTSNDTTFVTVWTEPERLIRQITDAEIEPLTSAGRKPKKRHLKIREEYRDRDRVLEHYRRWFAYTSKCPGKHLVVSCENELEIRTVAEWEELVGQGASR